MSEPLFVTWANEEEKKSALAVSSKALEKSEQILQRTRASDIYRNMDTNISVRDGFSRSDYNAFRPEESVPTDPKKIVSSCRNAYRKIGIVNNIINLMSDFTIQGAHLTHPNRQISKFYNEWWDKVNGFQVCGKFSKGLYRDGIILAQRTTAKLKAKDVENLQRGWASAADTEPEESFKPEKREIPWKYTFLNPLTVSPLGDDLAIFSGDDVIYGLDIPQHLVGRIRNPSTAIDKAIIDKMPVDLVRAVRAGVKSIPLDSRKVRIFHYKKDDYEPWADPMLYCVMDDLIALNKMKLADLAALDGAISHIRLWKMGSLEHKIRPTEAGVQKLADMLLNNVGGGSMDLIWGPELELVETGTDVYRFLGNDKYIPILNAIYAGLGIPPTLTGANAAGGFTNNYISLQTLLERLNYVRVLLIDFWEKEIKLVQQAMGFRLPAQIQFDRMTLTDEAAEKMLLIQLYDRNVITLETIQERFKEIPELERIRDRREQRERETGKISRKAGPWNNPELEDNLKKIALQTGIATPSEVGLELQEKKAGEKTGLEMKTPPAGALPAKNKGQPQQGRPKNSGDTSKRKKKRVIPRAAANLATAFAYARKAQKEISSIVDPIWLETTGKSNGRQLSDEETTNVENFKLAMLCSLDLYEDVNEERVVKAFTNDNLCIPPNVYVLVKETTSKFVDKFDREPTMDEQRQIWASVYALHKGDFDNGESED